MPRKLSSKNQASSVREDNVETVVKHTPTEKQAWYYTLREGGVKYRVPIPMTPEVVAKVEQQLLDIRNHKYWQVSPYGGEKAYTQVTCFPPFDPPLRLSEVYFPDGRVYKSTKRTIS